tara:strand:+ start:1598 stop:2284 length:687 start_codon:yes stop_codon:yes gene_type:complete
MIVSINQPSYLPWLGYFQRISISDIHVILDHVQFEKNSFTNRNKIKTNNGSLLLTIPLKTKGKFGDLAINKIETSNEYWRAKHFKSIQGAYSKAKYFKKYEPILRTFYEKPCSKLIDLIIPMNKWIIDELKIDTKLLRSSEIQIEGTKSELVLNICKSLKATTYLSGPMGRDYLNLDSFSDAGIKVIFHDYNHVVYQQIHSGFQSHMSAIDLLLNHGPASKEYLKYQG